MRVTMFHNSVLKNQLGFNMVELLVALAVSSLVVGVALVTFTKQQTLFKNQIDNTNIRALGRYSVQDLIRDLRMLGFGLPSNDDITVATSTSITYMSNTSKLTTTIPSTVNAGANSFTVTNATGFAAGNNVVIYDAFANTVSDLKVISSIAGNVVTLTSTLANSYSGTNIMSAYNTIVYTYDSANTKITRSLNGAVNDILGDVTSLTFVYKDKTDTVITSPVSAGNFSKIHKIEISITSQDPKNPLAITTFNTHVNLRNMDQ